MRKHVLRLRKDILRGLEALVVSKRLRLLLFIFFCNMSERASLIKVYSSKSPDCFRNSQNALRDYFNKAVRKDLFLEREGK